MDSSSHQATLFPHHPETFGTMLIEGIGFSRFGVSSSLFFKIKCENNHHFVMHMSSLEVHLHLRVIFLSFIG